MGRAELEAKWVKYCILLKLVNFGDWSQCSFDPIKFIVDYPQDSAQGTSVTLGLSANARLLDFGPVPLRTPAMSR